MHWKISYQWIGVFTFILLACLVWLEVKYAPAEIPLQLQVTQVDAAVLNPYPELDGVSVLINTASVEQLQQLPGIGPIKAQAIYDYIQDYGKITSLDQMLEIKGIGEKTIAQIEPYLSLDT